MFRPPPIPPSAHPQRRSTVSATLPGSWLLTGSMGSRWNFTLTDHRLAGFCQGLLPKSLDELHLNLRDLTSDIPQDHLLMRKFNGEFLFSPDWVSVSRIHFPTSLRPGCSTSELPTSLQFLQASWNSPVTPLFIVWWTLYFFLLDYPGYGPLTTSDIDSPETNRSPEENLGSFPRPHLGWAFQSSNIVSAHIMMGQAPLPICFLSRGSAHPKFPDPLTTIKFHQILFPFPYTKTLPGMTRALGRQVNFTQSRCRFSIHCLLHAATMPLAFYYRHFLFSWCLYSREAVDTSRRLRWHRHNLPALVDGVALLAPRCRHCHCSRHSRVIHRLHGIRITTHHDGGPP